MSNPLFGPDVRWMLSENDQPGMQAFCESVHPSTVAETLSEDAFKPEEVWTVLSQTGIREQAVIFEYFPTTWQLKLVEGTGRPQMAKLIEQMSHDDRVDLLRRLSPRVAEGLLRLVDEADRRDIATLFRYAENTVGAIMTTDYAWLPATITTGQAIDRLRQQAPDRETIYYIYILDEASRRLAGTISLRDLILSDRLANVSDLMEKDLVVLKAADDREKAAEELARYDFLAMPVVDDDYRLVGIVTHDDVIDVIRQEATEDLQRQGAVGPISESYFEAPKFKVWKSRAGWLCGLFLAQMFTLTAIEHFNDMIKKVIVLTLFLPLCMSVGGNAGSQAATLITRALALEQVFLRDWLRVFRRELIIGAALAASIGILGLARTWLFTNSEILGDCPLDKLTYVISISVAAICMWGTLIGSMLPMVFKRIGVDPAIASSPFIATLSDVTGIIIYFSIARVFLL